MQEGFSVENQDQMDQKITQVIEILIELSRLIAIEPRLHDLSGDGDYERDADFYSYYNPPLISLFLH